MPEEQGKERKSSGIGGRVLRLLRRPIVAMALMAAGFAILFPDFGPKDVEFLHRLPPLSCASRLTVSAWREGLEARRSSHLLSGAPELQHAFALAKGDYQLRVSLACGEGTDPRGEVEVSRRLVVKDHQSVRFDLTDACPCGKH